MNLVRNASVGAALGGALLFSVGLGVAQAQPLVTLSVGHRDILSGASVDAAVATAGAICGASTPADVDALARQAESEGTREEVCSDSHGGAVEFSQTAAGPAVPPNMSGARYSADGLYDGTGYAGSMFEPNGY